LFEQLLAGGLDMAILVEPPFTLPKSIVGHMLCEEPLLYLTQAELAGTDITKHIATVPFIRYDPSSWGGRLVARYLEALKLSPEILRDLDALETIAILVSQGLGNASVLAWPGFEAEGADYRGCALKRSLYAQDYARISRRSSASWRGTSDEVDLGGGG
jgi:DNA-binding transcriptional LysR family regulator